MRIAFIMKGGLHPSGRREVVPAWIGLLNRLSRRHDVHAFTLRHLPQPASYTLEGFTVHDLGCPGADRPWRHWSRWRTLSAALVRTGPFDVMHGFWPDPGGLAAIAGRRFGVPSVVTCDTGEFSAIPAIDYGLQLTARGRAMTRAACRLATRVHVTTEYMERLAFEHGYRAMRIPIGVALPPVAPAKERLEGPPWKLLQVASLNRVKDQGTLLAAVAMASREHDLRLDLIGEDTLDGAVQAQAVQLGVADRVTFHGYRPFDELPQFYQAAHLYVQSSRHEAAAVAVMEAAMHGLAIVGTRAGYIADWAPEGAVAVDPHDPDALARAIVSTIADRELRMRIAARAHAFAVAHDIDWTARAFEDLYRTLLTRPR